MAVASITKISLALRYKKGSFTYSNIKSIADDAQLYELGSAINSLQNEPFESTNKIITTRVTAE